MVVRWRSEASGFLDLLRQVLLSVLLRFMELGLQGHSRLLDPLSLSLLLSLHDGLNLLESRLNLLEGLELLLLASLVAQLNFFKDLLRLGGIFLLLLLENLFGFGQISRKPLGEDHLSVDELGALLLTLFELRVKLVGKSLGLLLDLLLELDLFLLRLSQLFG